MDKQECQNCCGQVSALLREGAYDQALVVVSRALSSARKNGRLWEQLGVVHFVRQEFNSARDALENATTLVPLSPLAQLYLAECYVASGAKESARAIGHHLAFLPDVKESLFARLTTLLGKLGDCESALHVCRRAATAYPEDDQPIFGMAYYMSKLSYPLKKVLAVMRRAVALAPDCVTYRISLARLLDSDGQVDEAYQALQGIDGAQFSKLRCRCCLKQLLSILLAAEDYERCESVAGQLSALE